jgi:hypothetical protein
MAFVIEALEAKLTRGASAKTGRRSARESPTSRIAHHSAAKIATTAHICPG